jgi:hypothetical protein
LQPIIQNWRIFSKNSGGPDIVISLAFGNVKKINPDNETRNNKNQIADTTVGYGFFIFFHPLKWYRDYLKINQTKKIHKNP